MIFFILFICKAFIFSVIALQMNKWKEKMGKLLFGIYGIEQADGL